MTDPRRAPPRTPADDSDRRRVEPELGRACDIDLYLARIERELASLRETASLSRRTGLDREEIVHRFLYDHLGERVWRERPRIGFLVRAFRNYAIDRFREIDRRPRDQDLEAAGEPVAPPAQEPISRDHAEPMRGVVQLLAGLLPGRRIDPGAILLLDMRARALARLRTQGGAALDGNPVEIVEILFPWEGSLVERRPHALGPTLSELWRALADSSEIDDGVIADLLGAAVNTWHQWRSRARRTAETRWGREALVAEVPGWKSVR